MKLQHLIYLILIASSGIIIGIPLEADTLPTEVGKLEKLPANNTQQVNRLLAVVEDRAITFQDYRQQFGDTELSRPNLEKIINNLLIEKAMDKFIEKQIEERITRMINEQIGAMKTQRGENSFQQFLTRQQLTEEEFKQQLINQEKEMLLLQRMFPEVRRSIPGINSLVKGRLMIFSDSETAQKVYNNLNNKPTTTNWNRLFEKYSDQPSWLEENGKMGWFRWGTRAREIEFKFFQLSKFEFSQPFQVKDNSLIAFKTGIRIAPPTSSPTPAMSAAYEEFTRKIFEKYRDRLPEVLREKLTVRLPDSVLEELNDDS
ncbi:MAG: peptidylprolyl isomerase [bacterium]